MAQKKNKENGNKHKWVCTYKKHLIVLITVILIKKIDCYWEWYIDWQS